MKTTNKLSSAILTIIAIGVMSACGTKYTIEEMDSFSLVHNKGGQTLAYAPTSGISIITDRGFAFKDLNRNGELDAYEDWRLTVDKRAADLVKKMSVEQIAGLMLYSGHQSIPSRGRGRFGGTIYGMF